MNEQYDSMKEKFFRSFPISEEEQKSIDKWIEEQTVEQNFTTKLEGAIGGRFYYEFIPTSIGVIGIVVDNTTNQKFKFRDLD